MKKIFCDASFDWTSTNKTTENVVSGKIAIVGVGEDKVEKVAVGKVEGLQQYINILELIAIARAVELASQIEPKPESINVTTDSKTAMFWARSGKIKKNVATQAHDSALEYLRKARIQFGGISTFDFIRRDYNPAGKLLEIELEKSKEQKI